MKKLKIVIVILILTGLLISCGPKKIVYNEGRYEGIGQGHHGPIKVEVLTDEYEVREITIVEQQETPVLSDIVFEKIPQRVIKKNNVNVDVVAGATFTSEALLEAIEDALEKAKK